VAAELSERIYRLASVILASSDHVPVERAILVAKRIIELLTELEGYRHEETRYNDH
jgi:hypothetical protein